MAKPNYQYEKRQRELEKKKKKAEKAQRKASEPHGHEAAGDESETTDPAATPSAPPADATPV